MGRPVGRPAKPTELKLIDGNPGKRPIPKPAAVDPLSSVPPRVLRLSSEERAHWRALRRQIPWLRASDATTVGLLCEALAARDRLRTQIEAEGEFHQNEETGRSATHYLTNELRGCRNEIRNALISLGATPVDRARIDPDAGAADGDPLEAWARRSG